MRDGIRAAIAQAAHGELAPVSLQGVRDAFVRPPGFDAAWRAVQMLENHDLLLTSHSPQDQKPRIAKLADPSNPRSWYARSRSRLATGLLLTGPGVPMLFMGQEFLEDKFWNDSPDDPDHRIWWDGLRTDRAMSDHLRFTRELIGLRRRLPALRRGHVNVFHCHNATRVLAFHRWIDGVARMSSSSQVWPRRPITPIALASRQAVNGTRCLTATFTITGSIRASLATARV